MGKFKKHWIKQSKEMLAKMYPDADKDEILDFLKEEFENDFRDVECDIYNNYEEEITPTTLDSVYDWIHTSKPLMTESGTFFKQHRDSVNPNTATINNFLDSRAILKKKKLDYKELADKEDNPKKKEEYTELARIFDLAQGREKVKVNSDYGVSKLIGHIGWKRSVLNFVNCWEILKPVYL